MPFGTVGQRGDQAAPVEEPARGDHRNVHGRDDLRQQQAGRDRTGVPAALAALHDDRVGAPLRDLLRVPARADRRNDDQPASLSRWIMSCRGASANEATRTPLGDHQLDSLGGVGRVGPQVHPERSVSPLFAPRRSRCAARPASSWPSR